MSKISKENSIINSKNSSKVPINENIVRKGLSNNSNKNINTSKEREFGRDITNSINNQQQKSSKGHISSLQKKYDDLKKVFD